MALNVQINKTLKAQAGFTLVELLAVVAIMGMILGLLTLNFAAQRAPRNLKIAQNQLVTDIRKLQTYSLVSRNVNVTTPVDYYFLKFSTSTPDRYVLQAVYLSGPSNYMVQNISTTTFPSGITLKSVQPLKITPPSGSIVYPSCVLVAFQLPYAKTYMNNGCKYTGWVNDPNLNDYDKIVDFVGGSLNTASTDSVMTITLTTTDGSNLTKTITINGVSGVVDFQ